jgi:hypothetical protein
MRMLLLAGILAVFASTPLSAATTAQGCTGPECSQQGSGGHECERRKEAPTA